ILAERVEFLTDTSFKNPVMKFSEETFRTFVISKSIPRNYSFVIMMTALMPQRQCQICRHADEEFRIVANSWRYSPMFSNKLFFGSVDFDECPRIFQQLGINTAPVFLFFSDKAKMKKPEAMDIQMLGFSAETIGRWISEKSDVQIRVIRPPSYSGSLALLILCSLIAALLYMRRNNLDFLYNRTSWALGSLSIVFAMTSGQMWNHIRGPPLMHRSPKGVSYVHGSSGGQLVIETYIIIILNGVIAFGMILMNEAVKGKGDPKKRKSKFVMHSNFLFYLIWLQNIFINQTILLFKETNFC
ncbi:tumor suppressor candidate 3-like isoform X2, partial [Dinothrombium tinctorium]